MPTLKETEASLSYLQCFLYLVSPSINVSIFILHGWIASGHTLYFKSLLSLTLLFLSSPEDMFIDFRESEKERERERKRETLIICLLYASQLGIEPATFWGMGQASTH